MYSCFLLFLYVWYAFVLFFVQFHSLCAYESQWFLPYVLLRCNISLFQTCLPSSIPLYFVLFLSSFMYHLSIFSRSHLQPFFFASFIQRHHLILVLPCPSIVFPLFRLHQHQEIYFSSESRVSCFLPCLFKRHTFRFNLDIFHYFTCKYLKQYLFCSLLLNWLHQFVCERPSYRR